MHQSLQPAIACAFNSDASAKQKTTLLTNHLTTRHALIQRYGLTPKVQAQLINVVLSLLDRSILNGLLIRPLASPDAYHRHLNALHNWIQSNCTHEGNHLPLSTAASFLMLLTPKSIHEAQEELEAVSRVLTLPQMDRLLRNTTRLDDDAIRSVVDRVEGYSHRNKSLHQLYVDTLSVADWNMNI
jgi:hypothetical protein